MADTQINTTSGVSTQGGIVALAGGGHAVIWSGIGADGSADILMRRSDANGAPDGAVVVVNSVTAGRQANTAVAQLANGGFVVAWSSQPGGTGAPTTVSYQVFDSVGAPVGSEATVPATAGASSFPLELAGLAGGGFVLGYRVSTPAPDAGAYLGLYSDAGAPISQITAASTSTVYIASLQGGGFGLVTMAGSGNSMTLEASTYTVSGGVMTPASGPQTVQSSTTFGPSSASADAISLADGGYVVAWTVHNRASPPDSEIYMRRYDASGVAVTAEILVNTTTALPQYSPQITRLSDGGFFVSWTAINAVDSGNDIIGQRFDASGVKVGGEIVLSQTTDGEQIFQRVGLAGDGSLIVAWQTSGSGAADVYQSQFNIIDGDSGTNTLNGGAGRDLIYGFTGNDVLSGLGGADTLDGGDGDDVLMGGDGDDLLIGGAGIDTASYADAGSGVTVSLATTGAQATGGAGTDTLVSIENLTGLPSTTSSPAATAMTCSTAWEAMTR